MSYTEMVSFNKEGIASHCGEIKNAWRGAMAIWHIFEEKYLPPYIPKWAKASGWYYDGIPYEKVVERLSYKPSRLAPSLSGTEQPAKEIWELFEKDIPIEDKIVLGTTYDRVLVKKEDLPKVIEAFNNFEGETSLKEQAVILQKCYEDENCIAVGWNQTSITTNQWTNYKYDHVEDRSIPYNCLTDDEHWWLFDEIKEEGASNE